MDRDYSLMERSINLDFLEANTGLLIGSETRYAAVLRVIPRPIDVEPVQFPAGRRPHVRLPVALRRATKARLIDIAVHEDRIQHPALEPLLVSQLSPFFKGLNSLRASWSIAFAASGAR